jgi:hypothetical protein
MSSSAFDFKQKLQRVQPKPALPQEGMDAKLDEIAERHEFVSREPVLRVERMRGAEPIDVLSVKGPLSVLNRFKNYCNETDQPYWRAIDSMLKATGR